MDEELKIMKKRNYKIMETKIRIEEKNFRELVGFYPQHKDYFFNKFKHKSKIFSIEKEILLSSEKILGINYEEILLYIEDSSIEPIKLTTVGKNDNGEKLPESPSPVFFDTERPNEADVPLIKEDSPHSENNSETEMETDNKDSIVNETVSDRGLQNPGKEETEKDESISEAVVSDKKEQENLTESIEQEYKPEPVKMPVQLRDWKMQAHAVVGKSHLKKNPPVPCQDAALCSKYERPILLLSDGAGSAQLSHLGSNKVVNSLHDFLYSIDDLTSFLLDNDNFVDKTSLKLYADRIIRHAIVSIKQLVNKYYSPFENFRCTLLITVFGLRRLFWLKLGDGWIIKQNGSLLETVGELGKGEYANETTFINPVFENNKFHYDIMDISEITGVVLLSDGAGEKLVSNDGKRVSSVINNFTKKLILGQLNSADLFTFFTDEEAWKRTTGDDKSIAISARDKL